MKSSIKSPVNGPHKELFLDEGAFADGKKVGEGL
jgi:hypothetical protein